MNYRIEDDGINYVVIQEETGLDMLVALDLDYPFWAELFGWDGDENDLDGASEYLWAVVQGEREPAIDTDSLDDVFDTVFPSAPDLPHEEISRMLDEEEANKNYSYDEEGRLCVEVYVGDVRTLTPSGKYYTFFARNNVTREEKEADEAWWTRQDDMADCYGFALVNGGDPLDIFAVRYLD